MNIGVYIYIYILIIYIYIYIYIRVPHCIGNLKTDPTLENYPHEVANLQPTAADPLHQELSCANPDRDWRETEPLDTEAPIPYKPFLHSLNPKTLDPLKPTLNP